MTAREYINFLSIAEKLKCNTRHSVTSNGRVESVAEHSWRISLMALMLSREFSNLDINRVIKMCLIHDLGEAITGDIPVFLKKESDSIHEGNEVDKFFGTLPSDLSTEFKELYKELTEQQTDEAKLFKVLDKCEALLQHNEAGTDSWLPLEYNLQLTYGQKECDNFSFSRELRNELYKDSMVLKEKAILEGKTVE